jgi:molybdopterin/thiamine biosynthesis adenylyltransferase
MESLEFLDRARPFFGDEGFAILKNKTIAFAGLGGVGGGAFLALVRCGAGHFRLAENGLFDPPDMNRQAAAFGSTMNRPKLEVYIELARSINPGIEIEPYPEGVQPENFDGFLSGTDAYVGVIDVEKGAEIKAMTPSLLEKHGIPAFTCAAVGFGALMVNFKPGSMTDVEFWRLAKKNSSGVGLLPEAMMKGFSKQAMDRMQRGLAAGVVATTAIGGLASNALLANEVLTFLLAGTSLIEREPAFAPHYVVLDFMTQRFNVFDIRS